MRMNKMLLAAILFCVALCAVAFGQPPSSEEEKLAVRRNGAITGRVVTADGQPISEAQIMAMGVGDKFDAVQQTVCDEEGKFKLTGLRTGAYQLMAMMPGYVSQRSPSEIVLHHIGDNVTITLVKGGVITGRVTDVTGEALVAARVMPQRVRDAEGNRVLSSEVMSHTHQLGRLADDRGVYRLYGLAPGAYLVSINSTLLPLPNSGNIPRETPTYHPSATRDTATEVIVRDGMEVTDIDIRHRGERGHAVSGTLAGEVEGDAVLNFVSIVLRHPVTGQIEAMTMAMGSRNFAFYGAADGEYEVLAVRANESDDRAMSAPRRISVKGADITGLELKLLRLGAIAGKIVIEKAEPAKVCGPKESYRAQEISLRANREDQKGGQNLALSPFDSGIGLSLSIPNEKSEFTLKNLEAGSYRLAADLPGETWYLRSITQPAAGASKKTDAARQPFSLKQGEKRNGIELTIAEGAASLTGKVVAAREGQKLPPRLRVHLIPAESAATDDLLRYAETAMGQEDTFEFKHLAPGKYYLLSRPATEIGNKLPAAFDAVERAKLRREAEASKNEVELKPCGRVKDAVLHF
jgi:hypothetical protein